MIFAAWCACCAMSVAAQDCEISLTIAKAAQKEELPSQVQEILGNRLKKTNSQVVKEDRKSTRLNSSHIQKSRMPSSA